MALQEHVSYLLHLYHQDIVSSNLFQHHPARYLSDREG